MFLVFSLRLVSSFSPLWSEKILDMISIFMNLLRLTLCPIMWSIFEYVPYGFENNVYCGGAPSGQAPPSAVDENKSTKT